jgi:hypothetical protein
MCAGGDLIEKTLMEAAQLLQKIRKAAAMQRDWETRLSGKPECDTSVRPLAGIFKSTVPEENKEEPIPKMVEEINMWKLELSRRVITPRQAKQVKGLCQA